VSASSNLSKLASDVTKWTGIVIDRGGRLTALEQFVDRRIAALGVSSRAQYLNSLVSPDQPEVARLINAITVGFTWFFRDPEQLRLVGQLLRDELPRGHTAQVWVAGCATGEDVYTLSMIARAAGVRAEFVGSDINSDALEAARAARYGAWSLSKLPEEHRCHLEPAGHDAWQPLAEIRQNVQFVQHNLTQAPLRPAHGAGWDLILCRNVLIYFDDPGTFQVIRDLGLALGRERFLVLGAADVVHEVPRELQLIRRGERSLLQRVATLPSRPELTYPPAAARQAPGAAAPVSGPEPSPASARARELKIEAEREFGRGRFQEACGLYAQVLQENTLSANAHLWLGVCLHLCGDVDAAARALRGALFLEPSLWAASYYLALCLERLERPQEARREYRRVLDTAHAGPALHEGSSIWGDLETWKRDVLTIAAERARDTRRIG